VKRGGRNFGNRTLSIVPEAYEEEEKEGCRRREEPEETR